MYLKLAKFVVGGIAGVLLVGVLLFGGDALSYLSSSAKSVRAAVKESVPPEFELRRARDLLEQILPEMQANIRLIAEEEVEIESLRAEIQQAEVALAKERSRVNRLRELLRTQQAAYRLGGYEYSREQVMEELARRFEQLKEAEAILAAKRRLLRNREQSLRAAMQMLERTRTQKARLEAQIESLEAQWRLVKAASAGSRFQIDRSKLAQTEKLIREIKKRLDVAERMLAHEARFVQAIEIDEVDEQELLAEVDHYLAARGGETGASAERSLELSQAK